MSMNPRKGEPGHKAELRERHGPKPRLRGCKRAPERALRLLDVTGLVRYFR
jgi:hypothetical protein